MTGQMEDRTLRPATLGREVRGLARRRGRPSVAGGMSLIVQRELGAYVGSWGGYVIAALLLFIAGVLFNVKAIGYTPKLSSEVLSLFFEATSGVTMVGAVLVSMRLIVEDRQAGTLPLLMNSSLTEGEIIVAKFLSAWLFLGGIVLASCYMPALIFLRGHVSLGHIFAGYMGLLLLGGAVTAIGTFASALARSQVVAGIIAGSITVLLLLLWLAAKLIDGPLADLIAYLALWDKHFTPFKRGVVDFSAVAYYLSVIAVFLSLARSALEARRWTT